MGVALDEAQMVDGVMAMTSPRLDRVGRILVRVGSLVAVVFVALPTFLFALLVLGFADSTTNSEDVAFVAALMVSALAVVLTALRLIARYHTRHRARPNGARPSGP